MTGTSLGASFRDPSGFLFEYEGVLQRHVSPLYRRHYERLMSSGLYDALVAEALLIPHEEVAPPPGHEAAFRVLRPERISFISYPYEWCFGQLKDAALLTLDLQKRALAAGMWLKDASAYNVQFLRGRPVFIDTLSFETYPEGRPWVAYRQFCRHFLAPLCLMAYSHVDLVKLMRVYVDGIPLEIASRLTPKRTLFRPGLLAHVHLHARTQATTSGGSALAERAAKRGVSRIQLIGLIESLERTVNRLHWKPGGTEWGDYYDIHNYKAAAYAQKEKIVERFLDIAAPNLVWDLGANTGHFSRIASERSIDTIAFDVDPSAVESCYQIVRKRGETHLLPLVMDLTNPSTALGWDADERIALHQRGPADCIMALALIHHLAITNNVPLGHVARFFRRLGRWLVVEFVPKADPQVQRLLAIREDLFANYQEEGFESAFLTDFELIERVSIEESERTLYLFRAR